MKSKLLLTILLAALSFPGIIYAQSAPIEPADSLYMHKDTLTKVSYGIKLGANFNQITGNETFKQDFSPGIAGGIFVVSTKKKWGIQAEAMISSARYNLQLETGDSLRTTYFSFINADIAVMLEYELLPKIWIQAGPQFSTFISIKDIAPNNTLDPINYFQSSNFSGVLGLDARITKHFNAGVRYIYGISNLRSGMSVFTSEAWMTRTIHAYIGYRFK